MKICSCENYLGKKVFFSSRNMNINTILCTCTLIQQIRTNSRATDPVLFVCDFGTRKIEIEIICCFEHRKLRIWWAILHSEVELRLKVLIKYRYNVAEIILDAKLKRIRDSITLPPPWQATVRLKCSSLPKYVKPHKTLPKVFDWSL